MAKYRPIQIRVWKDPDFENYSSNMKLIFLYLCTNSLTTESGIYAISIKTISEETGINKSTVEKLLSNGFKNVVYDFENNCVFVKNFLKYNGGGRPELIRKSIQNNYEEFPTFLWNEFIEKYPEYSNGLQTVNKQLENSSGTVLYSNSLRNNLKEGDCKGEIGTLKEKVKYADYVSMTTEEYEKLVDKHGRDKTMAFIEKLNVFKGSNGKTYKSDYLAILNWVIEAVNKNGGKNKVEAYGKQYEKF